MRKEEKKVERRGNKEIPQWQVKLQYMYIEDTVETIFTWPPKDRKI